MVISLVICVVPCGFLRCQLEQSRKSFTVQTCVIDVVSMSVIDMTKFSMFLAEDWRKELVVYIVQRNVQHRCMPQFVFCRRCRASQRMLIIWVQGHVLDCACRVLHCTWWQNIHCDAHSHALMKTGPSWKPFGDREVLNLEHPLVKCNCFWAWLACNFIRKLVPGGNARYVYCL